MRRVFRSLGEIFNGADHRGADLRPAPAADAGHPPRGLSRFGAGLLTGRPPQGAGWAGRAWVAGLYLLGLVWWGIFFNWGSIPVDFHDWAEISAPRIAFVRDAVIHGQLPLHMPDASALRGLTDRFLVIPDVITAPQMLLMGLIETRPFILVDVLILYTLGVLGLLWFRRRYALSPLVYGFLFLAFNFNGQIQAHFGVGHVNYTGYFLFPWLAALMLKLLDGPQGWRWVAQTAFLLFFMLLQGAFHQFIWSLMFLGLLGLAARKRLRTVLLALLAAGLLSAVRLLPPALGLGLFDNEFLSGYPRPWDYLTALVRIVPPLQAYTERFAHHSLGWWEYDLYLGWAGTILVCLGLFFWLRRPESRRQYGALLLPMLVLAVFSFWQLYRPIAQLPIPLLSSERVSARLAILPFAMAVLLAAVFLQRWLDQKPRGLPVRLGGVVLLAVLGANLWQHLAVWQVAEAVKAFPVTPVSLAIKVVSNHPDPPYIGLLAAGAAITLITGLGLAALGLRDRPPAPAAVRAEPPARDPVG